MVEACLHLSVPPIAVGVIIHSFGHEIKSLNFRSFVRAILRTVATGTCFVANKVPIAISATRIPEHADSLNYPWISSQ